MKRSILLLVLLAAPQLAHAQRDTIRARQDTLRMRIDEIIVASTRSGRRIEDEPLRVEIVGREEIEEKMMMTPGDIAMLLNETGGVRVQAVAPAVGGAAVRIQGLRGRYARVLSDGLPLYGEAAGIGTLQIAPMDLGQVEVIKGAASALYGASALGGVINLISRRPDGAREVLLNATTRSGTDAVAWFASDEDAAAGWTLLAGMHTQSAVDVDDDDWADMPEYTRLAIRPRLFAEIGASTLMLTAGYTHEERNGGAVAAAAGPRIALDTRRADAGIVADRWIGARRLSVRGSVMQQHHDHTFPARLEEDRHRALFGEMAVSGSAGAHTWVLGAAVHHDSYRNQSVAGFDQSITTPGVFVQDEWLPLDVLAVAASARVDRPSGHDALFSPRLSLLLRPAAWTVRASAGGGHHVPSHWIEEVEAIGLGALARVADLDVERARSASVDVGRTIGPVELNVTGFGSIIEDAVALRGSSRDGLYVGNVEGETRTWGGEVLLRAEVDPVHATFAYAYTRATEPDPTDAALRRGVALTPRHTAGLVVAWEDEERGRIGFESYYTGSQTLHDNPYRDESRPYVVFGFLAERRLGSARVFVNFENITDVRQSRYQPLLLPQPTPEGRLTTDAWAPLEGRVINAGVRWSFGRERVGHD